MAIDNNTTLILVGAMAALSPVLVAWLTNRRTRTIVTDATKPLIASVAAVNETVNIVKGSVDGLTTERVKSAVTEATAVERERGEDTAEKVAEAGAAARLEVVVDEAVNGTKKK